MAVCPQSGKKQKTFYGVWVLLAVSAGLFVFGGCGLYAFGLFIKPLEASLGWGRGAITLAHTLWLLAMALASPVCGWVLERWGARSVIVAGAVVSGLGFLSLSRMASLPAFYLSYTAIGIGMAAMGPLPGSAVVSHWFVRRRGLAIGVMSIAIGLGGLVLTPVVGGLLPILGWRRAYLALGFLIWILVLPPALGVIRTRPEDVGLAPDGASDTAAGHATPALPAAGLSLRNAAATPAFWLVCLCFLLHMFAQNGMVQTQLPYLNDLGLSAPFAALVVGVVGMLSAGGKLGFGWLCDVLRPQWALALGLVLQLASLAVMARIGHPAPPAWVWLYALLFGLGIGSWLPTMSLLISTLFGMRAYGPLFGTVTLVAYTGAALGPLWAGYTYDSVGSYHQAIQHFLILFALSLPLILLVRRPRASHPSGPA